MTRVSKFRASSIIFVSIFMTIGSFVLLFTSLNQGHQLRRTRRTGKGLPWQSHPWMKWDHPVGTCKCNFAADCTVQVLNGNPYSPLGPLPTLQEQQQLKTQVPQRRCYPSGLLSALTDMKCWIGCMQLHPRAMLQEGYCFPGCWPKHRASLDLSPCQQCNWASLLPSLFRLRLGKAALLINQSARCKPMCHGHASLHLASSPRIFLLMSSRPVI